MSKKIVITLGAVVVVVIVIVWVFVAQKRQKVAIEQEQNAVRQQTEQQLEQSSQDGNQQEDDTNKWKVYENKENELVWYEIPELKIRFKVNNEVADDLVYYYEIVTNKSKGGLNRSTKVVFFSSKKLSLIPNCESKNGPLGALSNVSGNPDDYARRNQFLGGEFFRQFDNFFVTYSGPQAVCATGDAVKKWNEYFEKNPKFIGWILPSFKTMEVLN